MIGLTYLPKNWGANAPCTPPPLFRRLYISPGIFELSSCVEKKLRVYCWWLGWLIYLVELKSVKILLSKSIYYVNNHLNFSEKWFSIKNLVYENICYYLHLLLFFQNSAHFLSAWRNVYYQDKIIFPKFLTIFDQPLKKLYNWTDSPQQIQPLRANSWLCFDRIQR